MKKTLTYLLCAVLLLTLLAACGDSDNGKVTPKPTNSAVPSATVAPTHTPDMTDPLPDVSLSPNVSSSPDVSGSPNVSNSPNTRGTRGVNP